MVSTDHHWIHPDGRRARPLTTEVKENRALFFLSAVVLVVKPVPLPVGALIIFIEVINLIFEVMWGV